MDPEEATYYTQPGAPSGELRTPKEPKIFPPKIVQSTRNAGEKMEQRMREWPDYTLLKLRPTPWESINPCHY